MTAHVNQALFIHAEKGSEFIQPMVDNGHGTEVTDLNFHTFEQDPESYLERFSHVVVSGPLVVIKQVMEAVANHGGSLGILPQAHQKVLSQSYDIPLQTDEKIDLALQQDHQTIDLLYCNDQLMLFKASFGKVPLLDTPVHTGFFTRMVQSVKRLAGIRLFEYNFRTGSGKRLRTAASGCMVVQHQTGSLASRLIGDDSSLSDGMISLVVSAPMSIVDYLTLIFQILIRAPFKRRIASTIGLIKSSEIHIESELDLKVRIDDASSTARTPLQVRLNPAALKVNIGPGTNHKEESRTGKERLSVANLPTGRELVRARKKRVPFFAYATEERFKDLFSSLYEDAKINRIFLVLMVLSTLLATVGLYLNSSSIIIGAMLLAPLMGPIVSLGMGVLRSNSRMIQTSVIKIFIGIILALASSALVVHLLPYDPVTPEMLARVNPSLLDLMVAVLAGIAGAYTKSFKEILQSLAGVAIAVALVPPLSVAGIGLGRGDYDFFLQAFLLFFTNFIGIVISASFTFRVLGYSSAIKARKSFALLMALMSLTLVPLYISYNQIVATHHFERGWKNERFLVDNKYLIVKDARLINHGKKKIITMTLLARDRLSRQDLMMLKEKIQHYYPQKLEIRAKINYIL